MSDTKLYIIVNTDLNMSPGKIGAQTAHSACRVVEYLTLNPNETYNMWRKTGCAKIVLGANTKTMIELIQKYNDKNKDVWCEYVIDAGKTEIESGSLTTVAFCPLTKENTPKEIKSLKTLKEPDMFDRTYYALPSFVIAECNQGQKKSGVDKGGEMILKQLNMSYPDLNKHCVTHKIENIKFETSIGLKDVECYVRKEQLYNRIPITLGGDHSIGLATVSASLNIHRDDFLLVWIDAHGDINTPKTSISGNTHGMPVSGIMGFMKNEYSKYTLKPHNIIYFGVRDLDEGEKEIIAKHKIQMAKTVEEVLEKMENYKKIHVSFDVDSLDPKLFPCTGTIAGDGANPEDVKRIIKECGTKLIAFDIVEFNPEIESDNTDKCLKVLEYVTQPLFTQFVKN